jgi:outer membrane protein assembly factor BamB
MKWILSIVCVSISMNLARAQFGRGGEDWMTVGGDAQRSSWVRADPKITLERMQKPGFQLLWKLKLNNQPVQLNSLSSTILLDFYIGYRGFRSLAFVGGSSDNVFAIDTDLARLEWQTHLPSSTSAQSGSLACPGGMTANVTRATTAAFPMPVVRGGGRSGPARSATGTPGEGAVTIADVAAINNAPPSPGRGVPPPGPRPSYIDSVSGDGMFHRLYVSNGLEAQPAVKFLPPNANAQGLIVINEIAYAATANSCGGAPNGVWALDLATGQVANWLTDAGIAGTSGPAFAPDGTVFAATGKGDFVALEAKTLSVKGIYSSDHQEFTSAPVLFAHKGKVLAALATRDGQIQLLEASDHPALIAKISSNSADFTPGGLSSWLAADGTRWLLAPAAKGIVAWKVVDQNGLPALQPGWTSRDLVSPLTPAIINGVVFALSSGEVRSGDSNLIAAQRAQRSSPAVLYALDALTGQELWNSGKTITSFVHSGGVTGFGGQVYLGAHDGTLYAFGFPMEH